MDADGQNEQGNGGPNGARARPARGIKFSHVVCEWTIVGPSREPWQLDAFQRAQLDTEYLWQSPELNNLLGQPSGRWRWGLTISINNLTSHFHRNMGIGR